MLILTVVKNAVLGCGSVSFGSPFVRNLLSSCRVSCAGRVLTVTRVYVKWSQWVSGIRTPIAAKLCKTETCYLTKKKKKIELLPRSFTHSLECVIVATTIVLSRLPCIMRSENDMRIRQSICISEYFEAEPAIVSSVARCCM